MKLVLLSGGSGKRLWPLSNDLRSKQFLQVLEGSEGNVESMVQRVWDQMARAGLENDAYIATSKSQVEMILNQLGSSVKLVTEPERRDTFPAIALAAAYLYTVKGVSLNEVITVLPVDPYVDSSFFEKVKELEGALNESQADLALIGVKPASPSDRYGYIIPEERRFDYLPGTYVNVKRFQEKPGETEAAALIEEAALWNCGVFAFKLDFMINMLIGLELPIQYDEMLKQYNKLPMNSFDYQVVEKANRIVLLPFDGEWRDLGTWETLTPEMTRNVVGKGIVTEDSCNTHLVNELDIPVIVIGLDNVIVAASPDGILVSEKSQSSRIKNVLKNIENRPMYEERRWGQYRVIDYKKYAEGNEVLTKRICIKAGRNLSYQFHQKRSEVWTIAAGEGECIIDGSYHRLKQGDVVKIPQGCKHSIRAMNDLEIIEVQMGTELVEEDIIRICMDWEEIIEKVTEWGG